MLCNDILQCFLGKYFRGCKEMFQEIEEELKELNCEKWLKFKGGKTYFLGLVSLKNLFSGFSLTEKPIFWV